MLGLFHPPPPPQSVMWLLILFQALGATADNFFSPILTQLSQDLGLPPRFAGGKPPPGGLMLSHHPPPPPPPPPPGVIAACCAGVAVAD